ncbi:MAG: chromosome segregation protein SMC [Anaerolineaceae bacterium]
MQTKLASLEMHGYKTFAKQTSLPFPARITAIVGPNGSGKSNVADSIRWVLGEQSYSLLRAKKTEDMIYIGSDQRARAGMASVSITFNNEDNWLPIDYSEVVLTRRAYRDGQNEYLLNNQRVRLKDFHELLAKTGLSDRTYTIIGQGLVDLALSIKPDERRKLFEEAAGIGLYRTRKEEALNRLESTQRNLERASDILDEIKPRLRSLEKQAAKVHEYKMVQESLQGKLRDWYGYYWYKAQEEIAYTKLELEAAEASSAKSLTFVKSNQTSVTTVREKISEQRQFVNDVHEQMRTLHDSIQVKNQELAILEERMLSFIQSQAQIETDLANLEETVRSGDSGLESAKVEIDRLTHELQSLQDQHGKVEAVLSEARKEKRNLDSQRSDIQSRLISAEKDSVVLRSRKTEIAERLLEFQKNLDTSKDTIQSLTLDEEKFAQVQAEVSGKLADLEGLVKALEQDRKRILEKQSAVRKEIDQNTLQINRVNLERNKLASRLELMKQGQESLAGFSDGAKSVLKNQKLKQHGKIITDLATKLDVSERYEKAISAALGEAVDLLVLQDGTLNQEIVLEISSDVKDRVAIIGGAGIKLPERASLPEGKGIIGLAADLVKNPGQMKPLVEALLDQFLVIDTLESVFSLGEKIRETFNLVTLDGEVFLKNGMAKLGRGNSTSKVSYIRIKKELEESISEMEQSLLQAGQLEKRGREQLVGCELELSKNQEQQKGLNQQINELRKEINAAILNLDKASGRRKWMEKQVEDNFSQIAKLRLEQQDLTAREEKNAQGIASLNQRLEEVKSRQKAQQVDDLEHQFQYLEMESRIIEQSLTHTKSTFQAQQNRLSDDRERMNHYIERKASINASITALQASKEETGHIITQMMQEAEEVKTARLDPQTAILTDLEQQYQQLSETETEFQKEMSIKERQVTHYQMELMRKQEKLESLRSRIEDDFGLIELEYRNEYSMVTPLPFPDMVIETLPETVQLPEGIDQEIRDQKAHLRRIGVVNLDADSEYREVKQRYESLTSQLGDLNAAIVDIQQIVKELDEIMQREFLSTFKAVSVEFSKMFARLFNGGSARLLLSDEGSPIEGGIEIEARLPGKREQGLVLLSGGERSLTAVALVFALLKISPTPFCVLDEVDAMLDESNVGRFIELIKDLSTETQFLLITHNRNTVQAADVIYGVTMGKDSASQVISLRLDEVDESYVK